MRTTGTTPTDVLFQHRHIEGRTVLDLGRVMTCHNVAHHRTHPNTFGMDTIADLVAHVFGVPTAHIYLRNRAEVVVIPRWVAMLIVEENTHLTHTAIGDHFGYDKGTVTNALKRVRELMGTQPELRWCVESIRKQIGARYGG